LAARKYSNVINIFLVLTVVRVEVERGGVSHVATGFIGDNGDIVADLILIRVTLRRIERVAHSNISRPGHASVGAKGVEQL
jgi:hypothetical protein